VTALALTLTTTLVHAQGPPGGPFPPGGMGGPGGGPNLIMSAAVQEDLALTDKQKSQFKRIETAMMQKRQEAFMAANAEGGVDPQAMMSTMNNLRREQDAAFAKILDKKQKSRLAQIELQREGLLAVARQDVGTKLKMTAAQSKKVKAIIDEMRQSQAQSMPFPPGFGAPGGGRGPGGFPP
jgi:hypothetical protein